MTASLPQEVQAVFDRYRIAEFTAVDAEGQPITWPVVPTYSRGAPCIDVRTPAGHPAKADHARGNSLVALLFSEPKDSGLPDAPMVLVQGVAEVEPAGSAAGDICVHVRPERVYVWDRGDVESEPAMFGAHMEEVRSGHSEEPERFHADPAGGGSSWNERLAEIGRRHANGVVSVVSPDGFPFSVRVPIELGSDGRSIRLSGEPVGAPLAPGRACLTVHALGEELGWEHSVHVRGDLLNAEEGWELVPHAILDGASLERSGG